MSEKDQDRAGKTPGEPADAALKLLLTEMEHLSRLLPPAATPEPSESEDAAEDLFDNLPV